MARRLRISRGGVAYHVINRAVGRSMLFEHELDLAAFEKALAQACEQYPSIRLLSYVVMHNHWHLVLWPAAVGVLSPFMQWLSVTHMRRWHAHHHSVGTGPIYQGRFKSFPIQEDHHLIRVCRYVERNPVRAGLVDRAQNWQHGSLSQRLLSAPPSWLLPPEDWPVRLPPDWPDRVNRVETAAELAALHRSVNRGQPYGDADWQGRTARRLGLQSSLRDPWRPKATKRPAATAKGQTRTERDEAPAES